MSAFLGPIHYWLYNKILLQEEMSKALVNIAEIQHWPELTSNLRDETISLELRPLEELIDAMNIHGWLQARIHDAELRYAKLVTTLLKKDKEERLIILREALFKLGMSHQIPQNSDVQDVYKAYHDLLLNGMPCDRVISVIEHSPEKYSWEIKSDIHAQYWEKFSGNPELYYILRKSFMEGIINNTKFKLSCDDNLKYTISLS